ncbi:acyl-CoA carboxylase epsilon subunit [Streptomyces sp. NPDC051776]|uniref:acyl-CoA carboxylase epsilon subunit n=1 Tax=Streptomyces sp. NPDC051776 TaxID=3155414 RepID=UPI0034234BBE
MSSENFLRVEKGHAEPEELAALTAVLLARAVGGGHHRGVVAARNHRSTARWRRLERQSGFRAPHSWQR